MHPNAQTAPLILASSLLLALSSQAAAVDWPWFGGPESSRSAPSPALTDKPTTMKLLWESADGVPTSHPDKPKGSISGGFASPVLADGKLYVFYFIPAGPIAGDADARRAKDGSSRDKWRISATDVIHCFDAHSGATVWRKEFAEQGINYNNKSAKVGGHFTPCVGDGKVFSLGTTGRLYALKADSGELLWTSDVGERHQQMESAKRNGIANNRMPISKRFGLNDIPVYADGVVAIGDGNDGCIAFDANTGKQLWTHRSNLPKYSGPIPWTFKGTARFLVLARPGSPSVCLDPKTGDTVWSSNKIISSKPFGAVSGKWLITGNGGTSKKHFNKGEGIHAYTLSESGVTPAWQVIDDSDGKYGILKTQCPVIIDQHVYAICGRKNYTRSLLLCIELATGTITDELKLPGGAWNWWSSMAGSRSLLFQETDHQIMFFAAEPGKVRDLGTHTGSKITNTVGPIAADGRLYVRGWDRLRCYDLRR